MSLHLVGLLALILSGLFGWMCLQEFRTGTTSLPQAGWTVDRRNDPALFWTFTIFKSLVGAGMLFAAAALLRP